ncbi:MAG: class I SAM-dependent DNA methyltransferase, partial [Verrucomicrobia bacterium]|nr:class I SAM-dependent DNA methyltransferase [Verrucomicrobiota bacterium]
YCCDFQWAKISPAVFGSIFQGVVEGPARRQQGQHYTSERDIMKVLRSLFLDDLRAEWARLRADRSNRRRAGMEAFHQKLRSLRFLDPACGCGNFLVLAYRELRALEIEVIRELHGTAQQVLDVRQLLKVDVDQFHGIELFEWPVRIAEVALWLMDHQMNAQAAEVFGLSFDRLPLRASPHIVQANALRMDWNDVLPREQCSFVLGNPPFVGKHYQNAEQRADMVHVFGDFPNTGDLDYVTCWHVKAADYIQGTRIVVGFVSTNSITQGEQVPVLWSILFQRFHLKIHFAHRTFTWVSEARGKAHVHVVIIGLAAYDMDRKVITDYDADPAHPLASEVSNITPYLTPGSDLFVTKQRRPLCEVPEMRCGNKPTDDGNFILTDAERIEFLREEPGAKQFLRRYTGSEEFINGNMRWCLWLKDAAPDELRKLPKVMERVQRVREFREKSTAKPTREAATMPARFFFESQPETKFIGIPEVSSQRRNYIPIGFLEPKIIVSNKIYVIPSPDIFLFGVLLSVMHMAWVRIVGGRLKSDFQYSGSMVYNTFPWPTQTPEQKAVVEEKARAVLAAREPHLPPRGMATLADLYDPNTMPPELVRAHSELDRAVEKCYRPAPFQSDRERVEHLFRLYEQLTAPLLPATPKQRGRRAAAAPAVPRPGRGRTPGLPAAPPPA